MHVDFIDVHFKWPEIHITSTTTASNTNGIISTTKANGNVCQVYGFPQKLVSDSGLRFVAEEVYVFCI